MATESLTTSVILALAAPFAREVFKQIVKHRTVRLAELGRNLGVSVGFQVQPNDAGVAQASPDEDEKVRTGHDIKEISALVEKLKDLKLVEEVDVKSDSPEFRTFYVTPDGLSAERKLRSVAFE